MATHDYVIANQGFPAFRSDLNDALAAIVSNNSSATEPTTMFAHMIWVDTAANPSILKIRNADNDAWITIGSLNQTADTFTLTSAVSATTLNTSGAVVFNDAGADVDFRVESDTVENALFVDGASGSVYIKQSTNVAQPGNYIPDLSASGFNDGGLAHNQYSTSAGVGAQLWLSRSKSATIGQTVVASNDQLGAITFSGSDGTNFVNAASIRGEVDGTPGASDMPGRLRFLTTPDGSATLTERMRIDSSGNLLVGKTSSSFATAGHEFFTNGAAWHTRSAGAALALNRTTNNGNLLEFYKDGSITGAIVSDSGNLVVTAGTNFGIYLWSSGNGHLLPANASGAATDDAADIGFSSFRWDDIYATNGSIQTSDRNEKQDIEALSEAETRVAVAAKSLLKKYRWKSAVAKKGDDARIHFGIIAQDLKAAFEAEGLDAGRYAMFIHSAWWETQTEVPAVEAQEAVYETQTDEEGNEVQVLVSEAVEGKEAYTRTDTYETEAEAPEGAVRKERMGIRYNELLAFIIAAL